MAKKFYDGGPTLNSNTSATANMPQDVKMVNYPEGSYGAGEGINDGLSGIDGQMKADKPSKKNKAEKY